MRVEGDRVGLWHCGFCVLTHVYPTQRGRESERALLWELEGVEETAVNLR